MVFLASVLVFVLLLGKRGSCFQLFRSATKKTPENTSLPSVATATRPVAKIDPHPPQEYDKQAWESGFTTCKEEVCCEIGQGLPSDLRGTYYRNGHAKFEAGKYPITHPFDGDGMVTAIDLQNGTALFRNRFVRTDVFTKERRLQRIVSRGVFNTPKTGGFFANFLNLRTRDVANTNVLYWAGRLLALFESTSPHKIEPDSLRTISKSTLGGILKPGQPFSAHPRVDANTGRLINFSSQPRGLSSTDLTVYEFDTQFNVFQQRTVTIPAFVFFHDFLVTERYYVFTRSPISFNPLPFLLGTKGPAECIKFDETGSTEFILIPRDPALPVQYVPVDAHFNFHYANGYDAVQTQADGRTRHTVVIDTVQSAKLELGSPSQPGAQVWKDLDYAATVPMYKLMRYTLTSDLPSPGASTVESTGPPPAPKWTYSKEALARTQLEFPSVNPRVVGKKYRYIFASASCDPTKSAPVQGVIKLDLQPADSTAAAITATDYTGGGHSHGTVESVWRPQPYEFVGEVVFAPRSGSGPSAAEDDGYLLSFLWDGRDKKSYFVVFDARDVSQGPVCKLPIPTNVPFGLHGAFVPDLVFDHAFIKSKFEAFSALEKRDWNEMSSGFSGMGL